MAGTITHAEVRTERLIGREPRRGDAAAIEAIYGAPEVARWLFARPLLLDEAASIVDRDMAHWRAHGFGRWYWVRADSSQLVARCGPSLMVVDGRPEVELHWSVRPCDQGHGFAAEAADAAATVCLELLGMESVVAFAREDNAASLRVMDAAGFAPERTFALDGLTHLLARRGSGAGPQPGTASASAGASAGSGWGRLRT